MVKNDPEIASKLAAVVVKEVDITVLRVMAYKHLKDIYLKDIEAFKKDYNIYYKELDKESLLTDFEKDDTSPSKD